MYEVLFVSPVLFGKIEFLDAFLSEYSHVNLKSEKSKDGQREDGEDDHVPQILHGLYHSAHDGLEALRRKGQGIKEGGCVSKELCTHMYVYNVYIGTCGHFLP